MYLIGQNGRAVCKKHGGRGDAFNVARRKAHGLGWPDTKHEPFTPVSMLKWSENVAIALSSWATEPLASQEAR